MMKRIIRGIYIFKYWAKIGCILGLILILISSCRFTHEDFTENYNWDSYLGGLDRNHYLPLNQINRSNVQSLKLAWEYQSEDGEASMQGNIEHNPLIVDGVLYGASPMMKIFALHAHTGEEIWKYDYQADSLKVERQNLRGLVYYGDDSDKRIYFTGGNHLFALNAETGTPIKSFGDKGKVYLKTKVEETGREYPLRASSPGLIYKDLIILGYLVGETIGAPPGDIQAYNIHTGELVWTFHTIPRPGEFGYDSWSKDGYKYIGGANAWAGMSLDVERGIVYVPTGSATFDFYGGNRLGNNLFANSLIALDAESGDRKWHYQIVHHDLWDRDLPAPPNLLTLEKDGVAVDVVAQVTKHGYIFVFDRETGEPFFPIVERPVPVDSELVGEDPWPTQPYPVLPPPFSRQKFQESEIGNFDLAAKDSLIKIWQQARKDHLFVPPSKQGSLIFPGFTGGGEWGGAAVDTRKGIMYINSNEMPSVLIMKETKDLTRMAMSSGEKILKTQCVSCHGADLEGSDAVPSLLNVDKRLERKEIDQVIFRGRNMMPAFTHLSVSERASIVDFLLKTEQSIDDVHPKSGESQSEISPYNFTGYNRFVYKNGNPAINPPWGQLSAIDLNKGEILWQVPLGELDDLTEKGIPKTGTENMGGPLVSAGGLVFIAATKDEYFRAFDQDSGEEVWKYKLPTGGYATPSSYMVNGKQYIVIACGGGRMNSVKSDRYLAFALSGN